MRAKTSRTGNSHFGFLARPFISRNASHKARPAALIGVRKRIQFTRLKFIVSMTWAFRMWDMGPSSGEASPGQRSVGRSKSASDRCPLSIRRRADAPGVTRALAVRYERCPKLRHYPRLAEI